MADQSNEPTNLDTAPQVSTNREKSSAGAIVTLIIIVAVIVIGAFYVWGERVAEERDATPDVTQ